MTCEIFVFCRTKIGFYRFCRWLVEGLGWVLGVLWGGLGWFVGVLGVFITKIAFLAVLEAFGKAFWGRYGASARWSPR